MKKQNFLLMILLLVLLILGMTALAIMNQPVECDDGYVLINNECMQGYVLDG
mgnify:CR=1 FL=1